MVARDPARDEEDKPLSLTIIAPKKPSRSRRRNRSRRRSASAPTRAARASTTPAAPRSAAIDGDS